MDSQEVYAGATHQAVLAACATASEGPILELGAGFGSTPLLHGLCAPKSRTLVTVEQSAEWASRFSPLATSWHNIVCEDYASFALGKLFKWDLVFIDNAPACRRREDLAIYKPRARLCIVHDTECEVYMLDETLNTFAYRVDYRTWPTWTTVVSDIDDLALLTSLVGAVRVR